MLQKLEKYADNLEGLVQQRTTELEDEKHKTELLLNRMLPRYRLYVLKLATSILKYAKTVMSDRTQKKQLQFEPFKFYDRSWLDRKWSRDYQDE